VDSEPAALYFDDVADNAAWDRDVALETEIEANYAELHGAWTWLD
jgi:hypothetical protein